MKMIAWQMGRLFQILGLVQTGFALFVGLSSHDAYEELKMLLLGALVFLLGVVFIKFSGTSQS